MKEQNKIRLSEELYLILDSASLYSSVSSKEVRLSKLPFLILKYLAENAGRIVSSERLFEVAWGYEALEYSSGSNYDDPDEQVRKTIYLLRKKISLLVPNAKEIIKTHSGIGYTVAKYYNPAKDIADTTKSESTNSFKTGIVLDEIIGYIKQKKALFSHNSEVASLLDDILLFAENKKKPFYLPAQSVSSYSREELYAIRIEALLEQINGNYKKAFDLQKFLADLDFAPGVNYLGIAYTKGEGVEQNIPLGVEYYKKAAELGYASAQLNVGDCYMNGFGVECDKEKAFEYYVKAATNPIQPDADAMYRLYMCYKYAKGVEHNSEEAEMWKEKAKQNGVTSYIEYYG